MYKSKSSRKLFYVDMFPMVNLALIILMFLLVYGKPVARYPININLPAGYSFNTRDPDFDFISVLVGQNKIMLALKSPEIREDVLKQMAEIYHIPFTGGEVTKFGKTDVIGMPLSALKRYINNYYNVSDYYSQVGILPDLSCNDELYNWIKCAERASVKLHYATLPVEIQADGETPYPVIKNIISVLQKQRINKFTIVYTFLWQR